jgi:hypothetical protein
VTSCEHGWSAPEVGTSCLDDLELVVRCDRMPSVFLRFAERHAADNDLDARLFFLVEAQAPGLSARLEGVTNYVVGTALARFIESLDFRGWEGERRWANADRDLTVTAVCESGGHIGLTWTLSPWRHSGFGDWTSTITTWLEAGAAKDTLAADLAEFLTPEGIEYHESVIDLFN